ncbi:MAG TPA: META domain-containing protein [Chloroflexota bacterium]|jgi:heat shock protein HslJ
MSFLDVLARGLGSPIGRAAGRGVGFVRGVVAIGVALALVTPAVAAALAQPPEPGDSPQWTLLGYVGPDGTAQPVLTGTEITYGTQDGRVFGNAGCNSYAGAFAGTGHAVSFSGIVATNRSCTAPTGIMEQEAAYLAALSRVARADLLPEALFLRDENGATLLEYFPRLQVTSLQGTTWTAEEYNNGRGGVVTLIEGTEITARFEDGRVAGSAGCNQYTAAYTLNGTAIEIGPGASTRMACLTPPGIMEQEAAYLAALQTARTYRIEGSRLILETADGARVASFVPVAIDRPVGE